jgi:hypothetical protein
MLAPILVALMGLGRFQEPTTTQDTKYLLRLGGNVGDSYHYETETTMTLAGSEGDSFEMKAKITETLARKYEDQLDWTKVLILHETKESGKLRGAAEPFQILNKLKTTSVMNDRGRLLKVVVGDSEVSSRGGANVTFPKEKVGIGDTWDAPIEAGGNVYTIRYQLTGVFNYKDRPTVSIEGTFLQDQGIESIERSSFWVDLAYGKVVSSKTNVRIKSDGLSLNVLTTLNLIDSKGGDSGGGGRNTIRLRKSPLESEPRPTATRVVG